MAAPVTEAVTFVKKVRKSNFSSMEVTVLMEKVEENLDVIQSKFTNTITNQKKTKIWAGICDAVNSVGNERRTVKVEESE